MAWFPPTKWIRSAGISDIIAMLALPQAIAYSAIAGVSPTMGIVAASFAPMIYAFLGSSADIAVGPTSILCLVLSDCPDGILAASLFSGVLTLIMGLFKVGRLFPFLVC
jgi:MFS superfamily sulfate permease-like transporter